MATQPRLSEGDAPIGDALLSRVIHSLPPDVVLVGGQALGFWMGRFGIATGGAAVSHDADVIGDAAQAQELADAIRARVEWPKKSARTALVAQLRIPVANGKEVNVDVLHVLYTVGGLKKSHVFTKRVVAKSAIFDIGDGHRIRVMDPFDLLESRVQNAAGLLDDKGDHVLTQAGWAIDVARAALLTVASLGKDATPTRLGAKIQQVYRLARSRPGRDVYLAHGIDVLDAIDEDWLQAMDPSCAEQLEVIRAEREKRHAARTRIRARTKAER